MPTWHEVVAVQLFRCFEKRGFPSIVGGPEADLEHGQQDERRKDRYHGKDERLFPREFDAQDFIREL